MPEVVPKSVSPSFRSRRPSSVDSDRDHLKRAPRVGRRNGEVSNARKRAVNYAATQAEQGSRIANDHSDQVPSQRNLSPRNQTNTAIERASGLSNTSKSLQQRKKRRQNKQTSPNLPRRSTKRRDNLRSQPKLFRRLKHYVEEESGLNLLYKNFEDARENIARDLEGPKGDDSFPIWLTALCIILWLSDSLTIWTMILWILGKVLFGIAYFFYIKARFGFGSKVIFKMVSKHATVLLIELIPVLGQAFPAELVMLVLTHIRQKKIVVNLLTAYGMLTRQEDLIGK